jgi:RNA polymerase-interacting CarD/CdnL/TRCF family regulator
MEFQIGDRVVHCAYGLGQVLAIEEQVINNNVALCYEIKIADLSIWVPADENVQNRLRLPISEAGLKKLFPVLLGPAEDLPADRRQRNLQLHEMLKDGKTESLCRVLRNLTAYRQAHTTWNEYDTEIMRRVENMLIREWSFILSITPQEASEELHKLLSHKKE